MLQIYGNQVNFLSNFGLLLFEGNQFDLVAWFVSLEHPTKTWF